MSRTCHSSAWLCTVWPYAASTAEILRRQFDYSSACATALMGVHKCTEKRLREGNVETANSATAPWKCSRAFQLSRNCLITSSVCSSRAACTHHIRKCEQIRLFAPFLARAHLAPCQRHCIHIYTRGYMATFLHLNAYEPKLKEQQQLPEGTCQVVAGRGFVVRT